MELPVYNQQTPQGELFVIDAPRDDGRRFIMRSDALLSALLELEATLLR